MFDWYMKALKQYINPNGRAQRQEYWTFTLINLAVNIILAFVALSASGSDGQSTGIGSAADLLQSVFGLAVFLPGIMVAIRRLHDIGKTGWWFLIGFIPILGWIVLLFFFCKDSQPGNNQYGPNPKEEGTIFSQA